MAIRRNARIDEENKYGMRVARARGEKERRKKTRKRGRIKSVPAREESNGNIIHWGEFLALVYIGSRHLRIDRAHA